MTKDLAVDGKQSHTSALVEKRLTFSKATKVHAKGLVDRFGLDTLWSWFGLVGLDYSTDVIVCKCNFSIILSQ